jgi:hypothetical protein
MVTSYSRSPGGSASWNAPLRGEVRPADERALAHHLDGGVDRNAVVARAGAGDHAAEQHGFLEREVAEVAICRQRFDPQLACDRLVLALVRWDDQCGERSGRWVAPTHPFLADLAGCGVAIRGRLALHGRAVGCHEAPGEDEWSDGVSLHIALHCSL